MTEPSSNATVPPMPTSTSPAAAPVAPSASPAGSGAAVSVPEVALSRQALERVLARAVELQASSATEGDGITTERLLEIAREVGIDTGSVRQALAEEQSRAPLADDADRGVLLDALGPATLSAQRVVPGTPAEILARLEGWMPNREGLETKRRAGNRMSWEPRVDAIGDFLRSLGLGGRRFDLVRLDDVTVSVAAVDATRSVVRFDLDARRLRRRQRRMMVAVAIPLLIMTLVISVPIVLLLLKGITVVALSMVSLTSFAVLGGYLSWRGIRMGYRELVNRAHLRAEQLLDELERGGLQHAPSLVRQVTNALLR